MNRTLCELAFAIAVASLALVAQNDFYLLTLFQVCVFYLCAVGTNVLLGYAGQKSLGQAGLVAVGAYGASLLTSRYGLGPWSALFLATCMSGIAGIVIAVPSLRVSGPSLAMVTLAFGIVVEKVVVEWTDFFGGPMGIYGVKPLGWLGRSFTMTEWVVCCIAFCFIAHWLISNMLRGRIGRALLAVKADEIAAESVGVSVYRFKLLAFVVAAVTCGFAGALLAQQNQYFNSDFISFNLSIFILLLVLFGGSGSVYGPIVGSITLVLLQTYVSRWPAIEHFINGGLLLFALFVMPQGLAGILSRLFGRRSKQAEPARGMEKIELMSARKGQSSSDPILIASGVNKAFGGVVPARDIDICLKRGKIYALIGPNGAGKTTIINMLSGIIRPDSGSISFLGAEVVGASVNSIAKRGLARTFQNLRLFKDLSVQENVLVGRQSRVTSGFFASLFGLASAQNEERIAMAQVDDLLQAFDLAPFAKLPAGSLAYGLQRRVELARAVATDPYLLLLDEPAAGLNPQETAELGRLILKIRDSGYTILLVEHHMDLVMAISDHVMVVDYGRKISEGSPQFVQSDPLVTAAYLGAPTSHPLDGDPTEHSVAQVI